jgi:hypothetical protein
MSLMRNVTVPVGSAVAAGVVPGGGSSIAANRTLRESGEYSSATRTHALGGRRLRHWGVRRRGALGGFPTTGVETK